MATHPASVDLVVNGEVFGVSKACLAALLGLHHKIPDDHRPAEEQDAGVVLGLAVWAGVHTPSFTLASDGAACFSSVHPASMASIAASNALPFDPVTALTASFSFVFVTVTQGMNCS